MLDIKFIRENAEQVTAAAKNKNINVDIDELLRLDENRRLLQQELDQFRQQRNELAEAGKGGKPTPDQIDAGKKVKTEIVRLETEYEEVEKRYNELMLTVPNVVSADTPFGVDESENKILRTVGEKPVFDFDPKNHMELGTALGIIDTEKAATVSGARFNYLFGEAALLQFALVQFTFATLTDREVIGRLAKQVGNPSDKPFTPVVPPVLVRKEVAQKMDRFDPIEDRYYFEADELMFVGSAEHSLGPIHMDETVAEEALPIRYVGYSTAFRREAGTYGKDANGIIRRHQFDKLEMETFAQPEHGQTEQELLVAIQEYLLQQLGISYQVVLKCTGDIGGKADFRAIDIEAWMPGEGKYRETHTADYMTDFQARRLNIKYKTAAGDRELVHMNDATAFAIGRTLIAILENYQQADGSVKIPQALHPYLPNGLSVITKK